MRLRSRHTLELQVLRTVRKHGMFVSGEHIIVAVSGGADSVALLYCLHGLSQRLGWRLTVAHLNHGIRGAAADDDEEFTRSLAEKLGCPFASERTRIAEQAARTGANLEELARAARYAFLRKTAAAAGATKVAVGHSLDDQAETVLSRLLRGSSLDGLSGIHPVVDGLIVRPLLECPRSSILAYLRRIAADFREDATNRETRYQRNRIRHELIPYLASSFNRRVVAALARQAELAREASEFLHAHSLQAYMSLRHPAPQGVSLPVSGLLELHPITRKLVVRHALRESRGSLRGITSRHVSSILALCRKGAGGKQVPVPQNSLAVREFESLVLLSRGPETAAEFRYELPVPGECRVPEAGLTIRAAAGGDPLSPPHAGIDSAALDADLLDFPLTVRSRRPGDRYGGAGHRKVKRLLQASHVPRTRRDRLPMVVSGDAVVWIPGFPAARSFAAQPACARCIVLEVERDEE